MNIRFLGTGTSQGIPVIGCTCKVCLSTDSKDKRLRSSILLTHQDKNYVVDVGPDFRQQMLLADIDSLESIFLTHEHNDHIIGLDDARPFIFRQKKKMPIYGLPRVLDEIKDRFKYAFIDHAYPGVPRFELIPIEANQKFKIDELELESISVMHGDLPIIGFRFFDFAYLTDVKTIPASSLEQLQNLDILVLSALRMTKPHHSHMILQESLEIVKKLKPKKTYLMHLSHRMGLHKEVNAVLPESIEVAYDNLVIKSC